MENHVFARIMGFHMLRMKFPVEKEPPVGVRCDEFDEMKLDHLRNDNEFEFTKDNHRFDAEVISRPAKVI